MELKQYDLADLIEKATFYVVFRYFYIHIT